MQERMYCSALLGADGFGFRLMVTTEDGNLTVRQLDKVLRMLQAQRDVLDEPDDEPLPAPPPERGDG